MLKKAKAIQKVKASPASHPLAEPEAVEPACPACGSVMVRREAKRGASVGNVFWGCSTYPSCKGTRTA